MVNHLRKIDRLNVLLRSLTVQGTWNFKALIGLGFCYATIPIAKRLYKDEEKREAFLRRHLDFFNSHPYFASWCLGAVGKLEEELIDKEWTDTRPIAIFKERLTGILGVIGDSLFWQGIKPLTIGISMCIAFAYGWMAIPVFLVIYNTPHFIIRIMGLKLGYAKGFDLVSHLSMRKFQKFLDTISFLGIITCGALLMGAAKWSLDKDISILVAFIVCGIVSLVLMRLGKYTQYTKTIIIIMSVFIGLLFSIFQ